MQFLRAGILVLACALGCGGGASGDPDAGAPDGGPADAAGTLLVTCGRVDHADGTASLACDNGAEIRVVLGTYAAEGIDDAVEFWSADEAICQGDGVEIYRGPDLDDDGHIDGTRSLAAVQCRVGGELIAGSVYGNAGQLVLAAMAEAVSGRFSVGPGIAAVTLPALERIGGFTWFFAPDLDAFTVPALQRTEGGMVISNTQLHELDLSSLTNAGAGLTIADDLEIAWVSLANLTTSAFVELRNLPSISTMTMPSLVSTHGITIEAVGLTALGTLPSLTSVTEIRIANNPNLVSVGPFAGVSTLDQFVVTSNLALQVVDFGSLTTADRLDVSTNPELTTLLMDSLVLVDTHLIVSKNSELTTLSASSLATVGYGIWIYSNPVLPQCLVDALIDQIAAPLTVVISGNDDDASCGG